MAIISVDVSIVIPLYNKESYINRVLECMEDQEFTNWECIIVNDGSTDNSLEIINKIFSHSLKTNQQIDC